jgi:hypothetical protein
MYKLIKGDWIISQEKGIPKYIKLIKANGIGDTGALLISYDKFYIIHIDYTYKIWCPEPLQC